MYRDEVIVESYESEVTPQQLYELTHNDPSLEGMLVNDIAGRTVIMMGNTRAFQHPDNFEPINKNFTYSRDMPEKL